MMRKDRTILAALIAVTLAGTAGCVTRGQFRENSASVDGRMSSVESGVEANEHRISDLKQETDQKLAAIREQAGRALATGQEAEELANRALNGRLLWTVNLTNDLVKFSFEKAILSPEAEAMLDDLAEKIRSYGKAVYLEIEGHTDSSGSEGYNKILGEKRAQAVRDYLGLAGGIPLHAMSTISYGESQPIADNSTREGRAQNRRVVIKVLE
ncbi:MAG: OmpA family protein [Acidobacteriota bacterium]